MASKKFRWNAIAVAWLSWTESVSVWTLARTYSSSSPLNSQSWENTFRSHGMHAIKRLSLSKWPTTATTSTIPNAHWLERGWLFLTFQNIFNDYLSQNCPLQQTPPLFPMHGGRQGVVYSFSIWYNETKVKYIWFTWNIKTSMNKEQMSKLILNLNKWSFFKSYVNMSIWPVAHLQFKSLIYDNFSQTKGLFITTLVSKVNHCTAEISNQNLLR